MIKEKHDIPPTELMRTLGAEYSGSETKINQTRNVSSTSESQTNRGDPFEVQISDAIGAKLILYGQLF